MESITPPKSVAQIFEEYRAYLSNIGDNSGQRAQTAAMLTLAHVLRTNNGVLSSDLETIAVRLTPPPPTPNPLFTATS